MPPRPPPLSLLVPLALLAFAGNSLLCRSALDAGTTDAATFTCVRLASGALMLLLLVRPSGTSEASPDTGRRALALWAYAAFFSWAYVRIPAGVGALVLFAFVQLTVLAHAVRAGMGPRGFQWVGVGLALVGLCGLLLPGAGAPDPLGVALMAASGVAWGAYTVLGRGVSAPLQATRAAFLGATPLALVVLGVAACLGPFEADLRGLALATISGAVTSALGYALWYAALPRLAPTSAATLQLAVPVVALGGAHLLLREAPTVRTLLTSATVLLGVALTLRRRPSGSAPTRPPT